MKAIIYSVHPFERTAFDRANSAHIHELTYLTAPLDPTTARLAEGRGGSAVPQQHRGRGYVVLVGEPWSQAGRVAQRGLQQP